MRWFAIVLALLLGGCPICPSGGMDVVAGRDDGTVRAGDVIELSAHYGDWRVGAGRCGGSWAVNHVVGGSDEVGTIDECGRYVAPAVLLPGFEHVFIEAADWDLAREDCADCCPYAVIELEPLP